MGKLCANCGKREMEFKPIKGLKDFPINVESDLKLLVCNNCGTVGILSDQVEELEALMSKIKE